MAGGSVVALLVGGVLIALGLLLAMLCAWWRWGSSDAARWWVQPSPVERGRPGGERLEWVGLVLLPLPAQALLVGALVRLPDMPAPMRTVVIVLETLFAALVCLATGYRVVVPLWLYPPWLRPPACRRCRASQERAPLSRTMV